MLDASGYRLRAACICVKDNSETEVMLVTSGKNPTTRWITPGGGIEPLENAETAALREVFEEAGLRGSILRCVGHFQDDVNRHKTTVFVMRVTELVDCWEDQVKIGRSRSWFTLEEALVRIKPSQLSYLQYLKGSSSVR